MATPASALREQSADELQQQLTKARQALFDLRLRAKLAGVQKPSRWQALRREIARVLTILREQELAQSAPKRKA